ncbi:MAG TPA: UPF0182 family protein, partial [Gemmatimonadaceae bacterium]|nr:UPF0182 family protein [Gemmatimonadaceae bacterium]
MSARRWLVLALVAAAITLLAARAAAQFYTTWAWYHAMGAQEVWRARLAACALLRIIAGGAVTLFAFANFYAVRQSVISLVLPRRIGNLDIGEEVSSRALTTAAFVLAAVVGIILASSLDGWTSFLLARDGHLFGETDPYFTADLGFFVYWLPFEAELFTWATASVLCVLAVVVLLYLLTPGLRWERRRLYLSEYVRRHLAVLGGVLIILLAWHFRLDMYALVTDGSGPDGQFTWLDHRVGIPGMLILSVVTLGVGLIVIWGGWTGQRRLTTAAVAAGLLAGLVTQEVAPFVATHAATPLEATSRERPYASARAGYTRRAYGVDRVVLAPSSIAYASLADAAHAVPAWDTPALARAIELESRLAAYPRVGWTRDSTGIVGVVAAPGQVPGPGQATPRGLAVRTLGAEASTTGDPVREFVSTADDDVSLLEPAVVLDSARGYLVVPDSGQRIAGVPLTSPLIRMAEALSVQNLRLWLEPLPQPRPLLVTVRNVRDRVAALAPFFVQGTAVAPLVVQDSLLWAVDLYSASSNYPLSRHASIAGEERSYFQHAATAIVSAATGRVQLVADSVLDPIAMTWVAKFPHLFSRASQLPPAVRSALPPALDGAWATATAF